MTTIPGTNPKISGTTLGMCKTRFVMRHRCCDTFYDMYEFLCECLDAVQNPSDYHDIYEEVAWTGSWDEETTTKAQGLLTSLTLSHTIIPFIITKNVLENVRPMASKFQKRENVRPMAFKLQKRENVRPVASKLQ